MSIRQIACCIDFSENAESAFKSALELAQKFRAKLYLIHVLPPSINPILTDAEWILPEEPKEGISVKIQERMQQQYGDRISDTPVDYQLSVLDGHISTEIIRFLKEENIDLVVMGAFGLTGMGLVLFGSVAKRVSHKAPCSVMIVRDADENDTA